MKTAAQTRRIALVVHSLSAGGAQRVIASMANHWCTRGWEVHVITLDVKDEDQFDLLPGVERQALNLVGESRNPLTGLFRNVDRVRKLRKAIRHAAPEIVVSFVDTTNVLTLLSAGRFPVVVAERTDPRHHSIGRVWRLLRRLTYPLAAAIVVQTASVRDAMATLVKADRITVIPNGVSVPEARAARDCNQHTLLAVGRLSHEKGFDLLIDAWSQVADQCPDWTLSICGAGPLDEVLRRQAARQAPGRVEFAGFVDRPEELYRRASAFVLPSRYEGFPNALLEAMAHGLPVASFDCESGPREIIRDGLDGILVPAGDVRGLAEAISRLAGDEAMRADLGERAAEVTARFSNARFYRAWEELIEACLRAG